MAHRKIARTPFLNGKFSAAVQEFGIALKKTSAIIHNGNKGASREEALREFFADKMPTKFGVGQGEIVDLKGQASPQIDMMFYDKTINFPFMTGHTNILAAEAFLAGIEVKSSLSSEEVRKTVDSARKIRQLQPYDRPLAAQDVGNAERQPKRARYYLAVFAYGTDLAEGSWSKSEYARFAKEAGGEHLIDCIYVLDRGVINMTSKRARSEDVDGSAISAFYFSVLNFIERESRRRMLPLTERYVRPEGKAWFPVD